MKRLLLLLVILILTSTVTFAMTFPQIVVGGGTECVILITNKSDSIWSANFLVRQGNQNQWSGPLWVSGLDISGLDGFRLELQPFASVKLRLVGGSQLNSGYIEADTDMGSSNLGVAVSFFYNFYNATGHLTDSVSIPASIFSDIEYLFPVERSAAVDTGFAWCPGLLKGPWDVVLTLYREDGTVFQTKTVTFSGHEAQFFAQLFEGVPADFLGMMRIESEGFIHVAVLRIEYTDSGFQYAGAAADNFIP